MAQYEDIKVSVIVPVYKCEKYIGACIESILSQTHKNLEIILILDGAADNSPAICKAFAAKNSRIFLIEQENQGVSVARNNGIESASGKWIMFVDGDDWIEKNCVEVLLQKAEESNCDVVISPVQRDSGQIETKASFFSTERCITGGAEKEALLINTITSKDQSSGIDAALSGPCAKLFRNAFLSEYNLRFISGMKIWEDAIFIEYVFLYASLITVIGIKLYHYRTNAESVLHAYNAEYRCCIMKYLEEIESFIQVTGKETLREAVREKTVIMLLDMIRLQFIPAQCTLSRCEKIRKIRSIIEDNSTPFRENIHRAGTLYLPFKHNIARLLLKYKMYGVVYMLCEYKNK